jgi:hypothetical protein
MDETELGKASNKGAIQPHASSPKNGKVKAATLAQHAATEAANPHDQVFSTLG